MGNKKNTISAVTALELLQDGNNRYVADRADRPRATTRRRLETGDGQWPLAVVLTCADSRVAPELLFDQGIGDLFVLRVAGNVASSEVIGSIQYAAQYLDTKLIVVLGHEACGAVGAAITPPAEPPPRPELVDLVTTIKGLIGAETNVGRAIDKNAKASGKALKTALKGIKGVKVVSATYGLRSGAVSWH